MWVSLKRPEGSGAGSKFIVSCLTCTVFIVGAPEATCYESNLATTLPLPVTPATLRCRRG